ncbi:hypothetical protein A3E06_02810 [Candidatus Giovannonibacteria bacterium RIFCSPHIGHO2_12_FULL_44_42]|nr:MAG: hypothetical protein A3E06_02810 [Candidatus Giovannonibacteria bacterium RIFCSPHIGHO2_12_FULL_44_42]
MHALSTPPAFILSQDQTLNKNFACAKFRDKRKNAQNFTDLIILRLFVGGCFLDSSLTLEVENFKSMLIFGVKIGLDR